MQSDIVIGGVWKIVINISLKLIHSNDIHGQTNNQHELNNQGDVVIEAPGK